jgi:A/G-specific adenine glycosylase
MDSRYFSLKIVEWYELHHRKLPWRGIKDPYRIWLSEVILQQTRVNQGLPYYRRFEERFPTVTDLANASEEEILRLWQGLGYYTRARNLHKCAKEVVNTYGSQFPSSFKTLKNLPGIGDYTAAAIASIAFLEPVAVVDGNVFRVLSRVFGIDKNIAQPREKEFFKDLATKLVNITRPDIYNQAIMEFGAIQCTPKQPKCDECIFNTSCVANNHDLQHVLPVNIKAKKIKDRYFYYFVLTNKRGIAMKKRIDKDIWNGLYDFHMVETNRARGVAKIVREDHLLAKLLKPGTAVAMTKQYKHVLTHQNIHAKFITVNEVETLCQDTELRFYSKKEIEKLPKPMLIHRFLTDYNIL